jgi:hypothetical protein
LKLKTRLFSGKISVFTDEVLNDTIGDEVLGFLIKKLRTKK